jgi:1-phosphatidylinositol phosphodiesterase
MRHSCLVAYGIAFCFLASACRVETEAPVERSENASQAEALLSNVGGNNWMSALNPELLLSQLSIPGTHESMARNEPFPGTAKSQDLTLPDQLNAGIRFIDIRCRHISNVFAIHHGNVYQNAYFGDVLNATMAFLNANPSEAVIMSVKEEYDPSGNTRSFEQTFDSYVAQNPGMWNLDSSIPTLGQARGKITLFRRFWASSTPKGIDASVWPNNTTFTVGNLRVEDNYTVGDNNTKWSQASSLLNEAPSGSPYMLYLTFTSGYQSILGIPNIGYVANGLNPKLDSYFSSAAPGRYGIIPMDFTTTSRPSLIFSKNGGRVSTYEAESSSSTNGVGTEGSSENGLNLMDVGDGEWTSYNNVVFNGLTSFQARVASNRFPGTIEFRKGGATGQLLATCSAPYTGDWQNWTTVSCPATSSATGTDTLYLVFHGEGIGTDLPNVNWFKLFGGASPMLASNMTGNNSVGVEPCSEGGLNLKDVGDGEWTSYDGINFSGVTQFSARVASDRFAGTIEFRKDSATGPLLATCSAPYTGGWQNWTTVTCPAAPASGVGTLYTVFHGEGIGSDLPNVEWFGIQ